MAENSFWDTHYLNNYRKNALPRKFPHVSIVHARVEDNPKGGITTIRLWLDKGSLIIGSAFCMDIDTYNKRKGKSVAFGRLMRALYLSGAKASYLRKYKKLIESRVGIIDKVYFNKAYNGDNIE